jgi:hypothetical protein
MWTILAAAKQQLPVKATAATRDRERHARKLMLLRRVRAQLL